MRRLAQLAMIVGGALWALLFFAPLLVARLHCGANLIYESCGGSLLHGLLGWLADHRTVWLVAATAYLALAVVLFRRQLIEAWPTIAVTLRSLALATFALVILLIVFPS